MSKRLDHWAEEAIKALEQVLQNRPEGKPSTFATFSSLLAIKSSIAKTELQPPCYLDCGLICPADTCLEVTSSEPFLRPWQLARAPTLMSSLAAFAFLLACRAFLCRSLARLICSGDLRLAFTPDAEVLDVFFRQDA